MGMTAFYVFYAGVLAAGGALGYARAKSAASLATGIGSAVVALAAAGLLGERHPRSGLGLGTALSVAMALFFWLRFQRTRKAMPAVPVVVLSVLVLLASLARLIMALRHPA